MRPAPLIRRALAGVLDFVAVCVAVLLATSISVYLAGPMPRGNEVFFLFPRWLALAFCLVFLIPLAYYIGSTAWLSATPGKLLCQLRVVRPTGRLGVGIATVRYIASWVSAGLLGIGYAMALFDEERRTLHDRIAGTRVVAVGAIETGAGQGDSDVSQVT